MPRPARSAVGRLKTILIMMIRAIKIALADARVIEISVLILLVGTVSVRGREAGRINLSMTLTRTQLTNALLALTPQQVIDLGEFEHFKKWTCDLFALRWKVNYSTAHRRLHKLVDRGAISVREGRPLPAGGRETDIYYPTNAGARMITRLRDRGKHYITSPDVSNPIDNVHDLAALEVAIRAQGYGTARAFQERTFTRLGKTISIIPDVEFLSPDGKDTIFVEVEQTSRPDHIAGKYKKYIHYFNAIGLRHSWLVIVFPDAHIEKLLRRDHEAAAQEAANAGPNDYNLYWSVLSDLRKNHVMTFDGPMEKQADGHWRPIGAGFMDCTFNLLYQ